MRHVIDQQMQLMAQQLALLSGGAAGAAAPAMAAPAPLAATAPAAVAEPQPTDDAAPKAVDDEEAAIAHTTYDIKKAFGAIARIDKSGGNDLGLHQRRKLDAFLERYAARTRKSKEYTQANRRHMADPPVVNGFKPMLKDLTNKIVVDRYQGAPLRAREGKDTVDAP